MDITTAAVNALTGTPAAAPTLAELLTARAEQRAADERENERRAATSRALDQQEATESAADWAREFLSPELATALALTAECDSSILDLDDPFFWPGYVRLHANGETWKITRRTRYRAYLNGPDGFQMELPSTQGDARLLDAYILDTLAAYPTLKAEAEQRRAAKAEAERKQTPPRVEAIEGPGGMLAHGAHLLVRVRNPRSEDGIIEWSATLAAHDAYWLLLTLDDTRTQRLVPVANVQDIRPLAQLLTEAE